MGTRGALGFIIDGQKKITYNHFDSCFSDLGKNVLQFLNDNNFKVDKDKVRAIELEGDLQAYMDVGYMVDNSDLMDDHMVCEYAYILNLDKDRIEIYANTIRVEVKISFEELEANFPDIVSALEILLD